jgi:DNA-binding CsgD family transcriptional regulator
LAYAIFSEAALHAPQHLPHAVSPPRLEALVENVPGNVYRRVRRPDGAYHFEFLSNGLFRHFGIDNERLLAEGALRFDWIHPDDTARFQADLALSAATLSLLDHRIRVVGEDGRVHWARGIARPERRADGSVVWDGIVIDVTREVEAEAALRITRDDAESAHRRLTTLVAEVVERLRGPMAELEALLATQGPQAGLGSAVRNSLTACLDALGLVGAAGMQQAPGNVRMQAQERRVEAIGAAALTARQRDVMRLLAEAKSNKEIAHQLGISPGTVRLHVAAVLKAMRARSRKELV